MSAFQMFFLYMMVLIILLCNVGLGNSKMLLHQLRGDKLPSTLPTHESEPTHLRNRKLLLDGICTNRDISISQSKDSTSGIPEFIVEIVNTCMSGCSPSNIHLHCGWFASARIVNPKIFKRLSYDDCLVNEGKPLKSSQVIRFTYSNSFMYPLSFKSARFC